VSEVELRQWLDELIADGSSVVAPVAEEEGLLLYGEISAAADAVLEPSGKTRWSPKEFLFPRTETLYRYRFGGAMVQLDDPEPMDRDQVLVGVRPCDAAGVARLDETFLTRQVDPMYRQKRDRTTVVSAACAAADPECFCTAVGGSPVGESGSDIQLVPMDDGWLVRALSDRGRETVHTASSAWAPSTGEQLDQVGRMAAQVSEQISISPVLREWSAVLEEGFEHPVWNEVAQRCLGCSACAYVCPSCTCFDMNQQGTAWGGEQTRSWDACTFDLFTKHASGHNPREHLGQRYRQRVLHKFAYLDSPDQHFRCVGCGRCVALCPAGMDIVEVVKQAVESLQGGGDGAAR
jgi:formate hydrogenlyase subunit 6/NADH:ubiquinone oxidoreductase subunit I